MCNFYLPKKPQRWLLQIIPKNPMAFNMPFSAAVNFKSHSETGNTKEMPHVSIKTAFNIKPLRKIKIKLKRPNSAKKKMWRWIHKHSSQITFFHPILNIFSFGRQTVNDFFCAIIAITWMNWLNLMFDIMYSTYSFSSMLHPYKSLAFS